MPIKKLLPFRLVGPSGFLLLLVATCFSLLTASPAQAGFSISTVTVQPKTTTSVVGKPRLVLSKGMSLKPVLTSFVNQYGWSLGWTIKEIFIEDAEVFTGADHEEVLAAALRRYGLIADRYPEDKGYMIIYNPTQQPAQKGAP